MILTNILPTHASEFHIKNLEVEVQIKKAVPEVTRNKEAVS